MSRTLKVLGNHAKFTHFLLLPISEEAKTGLPLFFFVQCIIKRFTDAAFEISRTIKVLVRVISVSLRLQLITLTSILIIILFWMSQKRHSKISFIVYDMWDRSNIGTKRCVAVIIHTAVCRPTQLVHIVLIN